MINVSLSKKRILYEIAMKIFMFISACFTGGVVLFFMIYILKEGVPNITWRLLSTNPSYLRETIGIWPDVSAAYSITLTTLLFEAYSDK